MYAFHSEENLSQIQSGQLIIKRYSYNLISLTPDLTDVSRNWDKTAGDQTSPAPNLHGAQRD